MKTKNKILKWMLVLVLAMGANGAWAQVGGLTQTGNMTVCINSNEEFGVMPTPGSTYTWNIVLPGTGGAGTITNGVAPNNLISILWTSLGTCTLEVTELNAAGCSAVIGIIQITVEDLPVPTITGPASICEATTSNVYTTESGMTGYTWNVSAGGTITAGGGTTDNTVTVTWNTAGPQTVAVNYTNGTSCTAAAATVYNVTVNSLPTTSPIFHN